MIIFKDVNSGFEMFTDSYKMNKEFNGELIRVECRDATETIGNDFDIGANASQEEQGEQLESVVNSGIDVVMNQKYQEVTHLYSKKEYKTYLKDYVKKLAKTCKCDEDKTNFQAAFNTLVKEVGENFDDLQFFTSGDEDGEDTFVVPLHRCPKTGKITMIFFKRGLCEEKC